ncbi:MAG: glycosyltransferase family 4 protein [Coriobacteriia bacterium]|nr:glycosyltransferase family 4 protein [Coriobacteriia bacterium]
MARIAIVTYFFPPGDEIGGQRPSALARNLARLGHDVVVLTRQAAPAEDGFRAVTVGRGAGASGSAAPADAGATTGIRGLARKLLAVPDGKTRWAVQAAAAIRRENGAGAFDAVITTGPPHSVHLAGLWGLRHRGGNRPRWIVDMRDLWTDNPYYDYGAARRRLDRLIEADVVRSADAVTATTAGFALSLERRHGIRATSILTGFDDRAPRPAPREAGGPLRVVHAGNLYGGRRDPAPLLEAAGMLVREGRASADRVRLIFIGPGSESVAEAAYTLGASEIVEAAPPIPHAEVLEHLARADALLLVQWRSDLTAAEVPGKLYEYLAFRAPVIALGAAPDGEVAGILETTGAGRVVNSVAECRQVLEQLLEGGLTGPDEARLAAFGQTRMAERFGSVAEGREVVTG